MEKLVHKTNGELVPDDPLKVIGTKITYNRYISQANGVITERALEQYNSEAHEMLVKDGHDPIWASWGGRERPGWMKRSDVSIVE